MANRPLLILLSCLLIFLPLAVLPAEVVSEPTPRFEILSYQLEGNTVPLVFYDIGQVAGLTPPIRGSGASIRKGHRRIFSERLRDDGAVLNKRNQYIIKGLMTD
jgi:hypothetical protein